MRMLLGLWIGMTMVTAAMATEATVWFGTGASGIYRATLDLESGKLTPATLAADIQSPGFLTLNNEQNRLYSLGKAAGQEGNVAAYRIEKGQLQLLDVANTGGGKATHLALSRDGGTLLLAHYGGGSVASLGVDAEGKLSAPVSFIQHQGGSGVHPDRQAGPHPHWIGTSPDNHFALVPDLGQDAVVLYRLNAEQHTLTPHGAGSVPAGAGPRHLKFHPNGKWVYVLNELGLTVSQFAYDPAGTLTHVNTVAAIDADTVKTPTSGSEIRIHPSGQFLYAGLRGEDAIAVFSIASEDGQLTLVEREPVRGAWPRNFHLDPTGRWLLAAGAESSTISVFRVDAESGRLYFTRQVIQVPRCICVEFQIHAN